MKRFWTADIHMGHQNIIKYCNRPFADAARMNAALIRNCNQRVSAEDTVVHVGDFCCKGAERGIAGVRTKAKEWLPQLNGTWVLLEGNHDGNNGTKTVGSALFGTIGTYRFVAQHRPLSDSVYSDTWRQLCASAADVCICGHVHERWKTNWIDGLLHVNVGVDSNAFMPLTDSEVITVIVREEARRIV